MALGGGNGLKQVLMYEGRGEAGSSSKIAGVDGLCPCGDHGAKTGAVQINEQILESFHFVGAVEMRFRKRWIGRRSRRGDIYVPEAVGAVAVADNGVSVVFDKAEGVGSENGGVSIITKLAMEIRALMVIPGKKADTPGIGGEGGERAISG